MENLLDGLPETPKALPTCSSRTVRSVGLRRRTPRDSSALSFLATSNAMADAKAASSMIKEQREAFAPMSIDADQDDASNSDGVFVFFCTVLLYLMVMHFHSGLQKNPLQIPE